MDNLLADLRHAFRVLRKSPCFTATAIFSVINVVLLKPLPYPDADRIMAVRSRFFRISRACLAG